MGFDSGLFHKWLILQRLEGIIGSSRGKLRIEIFVQISSRSRQLPSNGNRKKSVACFSRCHSAIRIALGKWIVNRPSARKRPGDGCRAAGVLAEHCATQRLPECGNDKVIAPVLPASMARSWTVNSCARGSRSPMRTFGLRVGEFCSATRTAFERRPATFGSFRCAAPAPGWPHLYTIDPARFVATGADRPKPDRVERVRINRLVRMQLGCRDELLNTARPAV